MHGYFNELFRITGSYLIIICDHTLCLHLHSLLRGSVFPCGSPPLPPLFSLAGLRGGPPRPGGTWSPPVCQQRLLPATGPDEQSCLWWEVPRRTPHTRTNLQLTSSHLSHCLEQMDSVWFSSPLSYGLLLGLLAVILVCCIRQWSDLSYWVVSCRQGLWGLLYWFYAYNGGFYFWPQASGQSGAHLSGRGQSCHGRRHNFEWKLCFCWHAPHIWPTCRLCW